MTGQPPASLPQPRTRRRLWSEQDRQRLIDAFRTAAMTPEAFCALPRMPHATTFRKWLAEAGVPAAPPDARDPARILVREVRSLRRDLNATRGHLAGCLDLIRRLNERVFSLERSAQSLTMKTTGMPLRTQGERVDFVQDTMRRHGE